LTPLDDWLFHSGDCENLLKKQLNVNHLSAFNLDDKTEAVRAAGACLHYARETQKASPRTFRKSIFRGKRFFGARRRHSAQFGNRRSPRRKQ
jgi:DNA mismatch repair ATPase MutS